MLQIHRRRCLIILTVILVVAVAAFSAFWFARGERLIVTAFNQQSHGWLNHEIAKDIAQNPKIHTLDY